MKLRAKTRLWPTFLCFVSLLIVIAGGMAIVWTRVQIQRSSVRIDMAERKLVDLGRRVNELDARIASAQQPEVLIARVEGVMQRPERRQIVWYRPAPNGGEGLVPGVAYSENLGVAQAIEGRR
ncbi:MAG: hypothetical protein ACFCU4_00360 [Puniceicoccaceae bacterium]